MEMTNRAEDQQPATSGRRLIGPNEGRYAWILEVREHFGTSGSRRIGSLVFHGSADGKLSCSLDGDFDAAR